MRPGMRCDLVSFSIYAFDDVRMLDVNLTLVDVVSRHEKCGLRIVALEHIKDMISEFSLGTVVKCECDGAWGDTSKDPTATIRDRSNFLARNRGGVCAGRGIVLGAGRAILVFASRRVAVCVRRPTIYQTLAQDRVWFRSNIHPLREQHFPAGQDPIPSPHSGGLSRASISTS